MMCRDQSHLFPKLYIQAVKLHNEVRVYDLTSGRRMCGRCNFVLVFHLCVGNFFSLSFHYVVGHNLTIVPETQNNIAHNIVVRT